MSSSAAQHSFTETSQAGLTRPPNDPTDRVNGQTATFLATRPFNGRVLAVGAEHRGQDAAERMVGLSVA